MFGKKIKLKKKKKYVSRVLKAMLKPILLALLPVIVATIDLWKIQLLDRIPNVSTKDLKDFLSDDIDKLSSGIISQIKNSMGSK